MEQRNEMIHHIKRVLTCLCIAGAFFGGNTANAIVHTEPFIKDVPGKTSPLGQPTDLTLDELKKCDSYKNLQPRFQELIDDKRPEFGVCTDQTVNTILLYEGPEYHLHVGRRADQISVFPTIVTPKTVVNQPVKIKPFKPQMSYFKVNSSTLSKMSAEDRAYVESAALALNELFYYTYETPFTQLKDNDVKKGLYAGKLIGKPETRSLSADEEKGLTDIQIEMYNRFGKFDDELFTEPKHPRNLTSGCSPCAGETIGSEVFIFITVSYQKATDGDIYMIKQVTEDQEVEGRKEILEKIISTLDGLAAENTVNANMDPKTPNLSTRQKGVLELVQGSDFFIKNLLQWKGFDEGEQDKRGKDRVQIRGSLKSMVPVNTKKVSTKSLPRLNLKRPAQSTKVYGD